MDGNPEIIDFDVAAAIKQRRIYSLLGFGIGFTLFFFPAAILNGKIVGGLISGTVVGLFGYLIAVIILRSIPNQILLAKMDYASIEEAILSTPEKTSNGINNLSLPQALGATAGIVIIAFLVQTLFGSGSDPAKLSTASAKDGYSTSIPINVTLSGQWGCHSGFYTFYDDGRMKFNDFAEAGLNSASKYEFLKSGKIKVLFSDGSVETGGKWTPGDITIIHPDGNKRAVLQSPDNRLFIGNSVTGIRASDGDIRFGELCDRI